MATKEKVILGVGVKEQFEASKVRSKIFEVCDYIAEELVKIWELWDPEKDRTYFYDISSTNIIKFIQRGSMGDSSSSAEWLFEHKTKWIYENVYLTRDDIADPLAFLSKHRRYKKEHDKYILRLKAEMRQREKEERRLEFERLEKEFGTREK